MEIKSLFQFCLKALENTMKIPLDDIELTPERRELLETRLAAYEEDGDPGGAWGNVSARIQGSL